MINLLTQPLSLSLKALVSSLDRKRSSRFGVPREIHRYQGTNLESKLMSEVCELLDIEKTRTTPLHPQSDGQVERYNRTLIEMLRDKLKESQGDWDKQLPTFMIAYSLSSEPLYASENVK